MLFVAAAMALTTLSGSLTGHCAPEIFAASRLAQVRAGDVAAAQAERQAILDIIATEDIGNEDSMELCIFQQLCKFHPMLDIAELMRVIFRMPP